MVSPAAMRRFHAAMTAVWFAMMPLSIYAGWIYAITFISVVSIYANMVGHFSSWQAARTEERQEAAQLND